jgi:nucleoside-diphosphate-sugar epimerase
MENIFIVGCGYIGRRVAKLEQAEGSRVSAMARSESSAKALRQEGIEVVMGDLDEPVSMKALSLASRIVYYFAPPPVEGLVDSRMEGFLSCLNSSFLPERVVLISTTGVYGNCRGEWVTEERPAAPEADRANRRLSAENLLSSWGEENSVPVIILRVPGIYGPGKLPEKRLRQGLPVLSEEDAPFSNRVHADDLARACLAAARKGKGGGIYNISDGHPTTMTDYFYKVADHLGIPRPPAISLEEARRQLSEGMLSYLAESKRLDNLKMREELGIEPIYPDLDSGLPLCLQEEKCT